VQYGRSCMLPCVALPCCGPLPRCPLPERVPNVAAFPPERDRSGVGEGGAFSSSSSSSRGPGMVLGCWQYERVRIGERLKPCQRWGLYGGSAFFVLADRCGNFAQHIVVLHGPGYGWVAGRVNCGVDS